MEKMTHTELVERAAKWLRSIGCGVVLAEFTTAAGEIPDAIGWWNSWSILVECKASRADFFADAHKPSRQPKSAGNCLGQERWYMTPPGMLRPEEVPKGWGLVEALPTMNRRKVTPVGSHFLGMNPRSQAVSAKELPMLLSALRRLTIGAGTDELMTALTKGMNNPPKISVDVPTS